MFVRKKKNKSGVISIQIIDKSSGQYKLLKTIGSSADPVRVEQLNQQAFLEIPKLTGQQQINFDAVKEEAFENTVFDSIEDWQLVGPDLVLGKLFDETGFNVIGDQLFRDMVITRLVYPVSKLKTIDYLYKYKFIF